LIEGNPKPLAANLRTWLAPALEAHGPSRMTQALMELGATVCAPIPICAACPLSDRCAAQLAGRASTIPPPAKRATPKASTLWLLALEAEDHFLLHSPAAKGLLAGLWRWPTFDAATYSPQPTAHSLIATAHSPQPIVAWPGWTQIYSHRRESVNPLHIHLVSRFAPAEGLCWVSQRELRGLPLGKRDLRLRDLLEAPGQVPLEAPELKELIRACAAPST